MDASDTSPESPSELPSEFPTGFASNGAANAELVGCWATASPQLLATVLNHAIDAEDLSGFAALLSDIARDRGLKGDRAAHQSIYDMPYASLLPRQQHLLADAFDLIVKLGLELQPRRPRLVD